VISGAARGSRWECAGSAGESAAGPPRRGAGGRGDFAVLVGHAGAVDQPRGLRRRRRAARRAAGPPDSTPDAVADPAAGPSAPQPEPVASPTNVAPGSAGPVPPETADPAGRRRVPERDGVHGHPGPPLTTAPAGSGTPGEPPRASSPGSGEPARGSGRPPRDDPSERSLRSLVTTRSTQVSPTAALRAREVALPSAADLDAAEAELVVVRRHYVPPTALATGRVRDRAKPPGR